MKAPVQEIDGVIGGVAQACQKAKKEGADDDAIGVDDGIAMKREADPLGDYNSQSATLHDAFWPLFLLRRGLRQDKAMPEPKHRHLMTYYDSRFAKDMGLLTPFQTKPPCRRGPLRRGRDGKLLPP